MAQSLAVPAPPETHVPKRLVVFDLDGTLTYRDTFVPYVLQYCRSRPWLYLRLPAMVPMIVGFLLRVADRGDMKAALIRCVLGGRTRAEIQRWNDYYVPHVLEYEMRPEALAALAQHRRNGDRLVLLSASPDLYVPLLGEKLGFHETLCTGIRWIDDRVLGSLATPNRRDKEKAQCIQSLRQGHPGFILVAYANGESDIEHLKLADEKMLVNGTARARREAKRLGIPVGDWH